MRDRDQLLAALGRGETVEYLHFWSHRRAPSGAVTKNCMSQWYEAEFAHNGSRYLTAEHFMMARKAELFGDLATRDQILLAQDPGKAKALGRGVKNFDDTIWLQHRWDIVVEANLLKFGQRSELGHFLICTGQRVLVEASPLDAIWGIGLSADVPEASNPEQWQGLNLLGFALMEVRDQLRAAQVAVSSRGESSAVPRPGNGVR